MYNTLNNETYQDCGKCLFPAIICSTGEPRSRTSCVRIGRTGAKGAIFRDHGDGPDPDTYRAGEKRERQSDPEPRYNRRQQHSPDHMPEKTEIHQEIGRKTGFSRDPKKYGDADSVGVRRYQGLPSPAGGEQTLLNTSPFKYMNPLPRGEKVNKSRAAQASCDPLQPLTYK